MTFKPVFHYLYQELNIFIKEMIILRDNFVLLYYLHPKYHKLKKRN